MYSLIQKLYPICRSITGDGVRETLNIIRDIIPIKLLNVKTGYNAFDWTVPKEWRVNQAYIKKINGEKIVDFKDHNLHLLNYSTSKKGIINIDELKKHIYTLSKYPKWIPYKTSYYKSNWGFCMEHNRYLELTDDKYEVYIDAEHIDGQLDYGEIIIKGEIDKEILISCYICHPSMCNDSISGVVLATYLAKWLLNRDNYYSYRIIFIPETIGSIVYIHKNYEVLKKNVIGGYVITCVGDDGDFTYLKTRSNGITNKVTLYALNESGYNYKLREFYTCGSDERQFNSPGVDLGIGSLMKSKYDEFDQYHTSADDLNYISESALNKSFNMYKRCIEIFDSNLIYKTKILCEPQLGKYGLYNSIGASKYATYSKPRTYIKILKYCDGEHDLIDLCKIFDIEYDYIKECINDLFYNSLLTKN